MHFSEFLYKNEAKNEMKRLKRKFKFQKISIIHPYIINMFGCVVIGL